MASCQKSKMSRLTWDLYSTHYRNLYEFPFYDVKFRPEPLGNRESLYNLKRGSSRICGSSSALSELAYSQGDVFSFSTLKRL